LTTAVRAKRRETVALMCVPRVKGRPD
jgi:hypothetical protein